MCLLSSKQIVAGFVLWTLMSTVAAAAPDTAPLIVLAENTDVTGKDLRLNYPLLISRERGYQIRCAAQSDEEDVIRGLGFVTMPSTVLEPLSPIVTAAAPQENPVLCPRSASYAIRAFHHNDVGGDRFYLQFPEAIGSAAYTNKLYIPGCKGLFDALKIDLSSVTEADPNPFFANAIFEIECKAGEPFPFAPQTFAAWCTKADLTPGQARTVAAMLKATPEGEAALGNPTACQRADAFLKALPSLDLSGLQLTDVAALAPLSNLNLLNLSGNKLTDIAALAHLTSLRVLDLSGNILSNLSPLSLLGTLTELDLADNRISNLRPLTSMSALNKLDLSHNQISDIGPISRLLALTQLNLANNTLSGAAIEPITGLSALTVLDLSNNQVETLEHVGEFPSTVSIRLAGNPVDANQITTFADTCLLHQKDATPFGLTIRALVKATSKLTCQDAADVLSSNATLALNNEGISDVRPLALLGDLRHLDLSSNSIVDVSPLKRLTELRQLELAANNIRDITPIGQLLKLDKLDLTDNPVDLSDYLSACLMRNSESQLTSDQRIEVMALFAAAQKLTCLDSQEHLQRIASLRIAGAQLKTLDYFSVLQNVETLVLPDNRLTTVAGLQGLTRLTRLDLEKNQLNNLDSLRELSNLTTLSVVNNPIRNLDGLLSLSFLETLDISDTSIRYIRPIDSLLRLRHVGMRNLSIAYLNFTDYCLVKKYDPLSLGERRPLVDAIVGIANSFGVDSSNCKLISDWAARLEILNLNKRGIRDLDPIRSFHALRELFLARNQVKDIRPLSDLKRLERLSLARNVIDEVPGFFSGGNGLSSGIKWLDLSNNNIVFVGGGWNIPKGILTLYLSGNKINNVKQLAGIPNLTTLDLRNNEIDDARSVLKFAPYLGGNPVCLIRTDPETESACARVPSNEFALQ